MAGRAHVVPVVSVIDHDKTSLRLGRVEETAPDAHSAFAFGRRLALLHDSGAPAFGWAPAEPAWFGRSTLRSRLRSHHVRRSPSSGWRPGWSLWRTTSTISCRKTRTTPSPRRSTPSPAAPSTGSQEREQETPARVHGDLWAGNLMWTPDGCTLIDPAAHGGHRLEDLAMLALFGTPLLDDIFAGYEAVHPMPVGWRDDLPVHNFFALLAHVKLFGAGFLGADSQRGTGDQRPSAGPWSPMRARSAFAMPRARGECPSAVQVFDRVVRLLLDNCPPYSLVSWSWMASGDIDMSSW